MINLIFSPQWFFGKDILIDVVSILVLLFISFFAWRFYALNKGRKSYALLAVSFLLLALSFCSKVLTNFTLYSVKEHKVQLGLQTFTFQFINYSDNFFLFGTLIYRLLTIYGFYLLYSLYYKKQDKTMIFMMLYFIFVSTYFTWSAYYLFHLTVFFLLLFILFKLYCNCKMTKDLPARWLFVSFATIALSQLFFMFIRMEEELYVVAEGVQLLGYIILLVGFLMVLYYGKKKVQS